MQFFKEIKHRKLNFLLGVIAVAVAVGIVVVFFTMTKASQNETRRLTRDMGFNLRIVPATTDMNQFWISGYSSQTIPESYVNKLVEKKSIYYAHLTATLHKQIDWRNQRVILTGISPDELEPGGKKKSKMIFAIKPQKVYVGYELAKAEQINEGDSINILGSLFEVEKTLSETGSEDDVRFYFDLNSLQKLVKMEGRINEIMALNCMCSTKGDDPLGALRDELEKILPEAKVIMNKDIAVARERQRKMVNEYFQILLPLIFILCAIGITVVTTLNTLARKHEIGILRAIGYSTFKVAMLFFQRAILIGIIASLIGFGLGTWFSITYGPIIFKVTFTAIQPIPALLAYALFLTPMFTVVASFIPVMYAVSQQPAQILKQD